MTSKRWKAVEAYYCRALGGQRRGADYSDDGGKNDCLCAAYSVEIRHRKTISYSDIVDQVAKARARAEDGQIPIHITHKPGDRLDKAIVHMAWQDFIDWFVSPVEADNEN